ncbi:MAG: ribosome small subunit-dependent GTPase A [Calditrichia bacterium]
MKLEDLGLTNSIAEFILEQNPGNFEAGRVVAEHKERYTVCTETGEFDAEITGNMRYSAQSREDFPAVGDWVAVAVYDPDFSIIHKIFPRFSLIKRQAVGRFGEMQVIAANIDYAFVVQAVDRDFNLNRLERYLTICYASKVNPIILLTKTDLIGEQRIAEMSDSIRQRVKNIPVIAISNQSRSGYDSLEQVFEKGKTYCLLGSSGVGKSTLLNNLSGQNRMKTGTISRSTNKGRHVTSHRELTVLENGSILIDNPGMREVGVADSGGGLETTFDQIATLSEKCRFKDCTHQHEAGCKVILAVEEGELDRAAYENYRKMEKEKSYFHSTVAERRKREKKFGKIMKNYKKQMKKKR